MHIRRGDDLTGRTPRRKNHTNSMRWVEGEYYDKLLARLIKIKNSKIHVFSQSSPMISEKWKKEDKICLHEEAFGSGKFYDHWHKLVRSDILFLSPSVYSHSAGLFSKGKVVTLRSDSDYLTNFPLTPEAWIKNKKHYIGEK